MQERVRSTLSEQAPHGSPSATGDRVGATRLTWTCGAAVAGCYRRAPPMATCYPAISPPGLDTGRRAAPSLRTGPDCPDWQ